MDASTSTERISAVGVLASSLAIRLSLDDLERLLRELELLTEEKRLQEAALSTIRDDSVGKERSLTDHKAQKEKRAEV